MSETELKIKLLDDPALRKRSRPIKDITVVHRDVLSQMAQLMYAAQGIGLAAPQVGINEFMIVLDIGHGLYKLINPKIIKKEGLQVMEEGCLSLPGIGVKVRRAKKVVVEAQDEFGNPVTIEAEDLFACVLQHEIDHLKGKLIVNYASFFQRLRIKRKLEELSRQATKIEGGIPLTYQVGLAGKKRSEDEKLSEAKRKSSKLQL